MQTGTMTDLWSVASPRAEHPGLRRTPQCIVTEEQLPDSSRARLTEDTTKVEFVHITLRIKETGVEKAAAFHGLRV